jgi:hypothetical protein
MSISKSTFDEKHKVFIVSAGRTGTKFFAEILPQVIPDCYAVHEPDNIKIARPNLIRNVIKQVKEQSGMGSLILLKALGFTGARNLSLRRLNNKLDGQSVINQFKTERQWTERIRCNIYVESNHQLFGFSEDLLMLPNTTVIYMVRNPFDWIRSCMNLNQGWYGKKDLLTMVNFLGFKRISPRNIGIVVAQWKEYSQCLKLAWLWNYLNSIFYKISSDSRNAWLFRFEDIFIQKDGETIHAFLNLLINNKNTLRESHNVFMRSLEKKIHSGYIHDIEWDFSPKELNNVKKMCGSLMKKFDYS